MSEESIWSRVERTEALPTDELVHPRVLDLPEGEARTLVFASYIDVPSSRALFDALRPAVEAAWLSELSTPRTPEAAAPVIGSMELFCFGALPADAEAGVRAFGFSSTATDARSEAHLRLLRSEASRAQLPVPEQVRELFRADAHYAEGAAASALEALSASLGADAFGERPGALARALVSQLGQALPGLDADFAGLDALEAALFTSTPGVIRGVPPAAFAALADLVGVCLTRELGLEVAWAVSEAHEGGVFEPPLLRVSPPGGEGQHFPVGLELLRRCVMPRGADEDIPPLSEWLRHGFGD
ncbi:MAG: hypothetical protein GW913_08290 [Myxococcales bacterium]|nr:hypothetical protein [Myxococcales bacterium]